MLPNIFQEKIVARTQAKHDPISNVREPDCQITAIIRQIPVFIITWANVLKSVEAAPPPPSAI